jgi:excisionase family DNA binding protein
MEVQDMGQKLIDAKEAASLLNVKVGTIYLWAAQKKDGLPSYRIGRCRRFDPIELLEWAKKAFIK